MATSRSPDTPGTMPPRSMKGVFSSSGGTSRRPSTSSITGGYVSQTSQGIGYSPGSSTTYQTTPNPAGSGIPAFRTLRSLLPFGGPSKNASSSSITPSPSTSKSPFSAFGSVRRKSTSKERRTSVSSDVVTPVIAIMKPDRPVAEETPIRRSVSLPRLEMSPREPNFPPFLDEKHLGNTPTSGSTRRTPSPGPSLTAELSTIIEADSSGVSRHFPDNNPSQSRSASPPRIIVDDFVSPTPRRRNGSSSGTLAANRHPARTNSVDFADTSALDLSMSEVAGQVRDALRKSNASSKSGEEWDHAHKAVIIDADDHPDAVADTSFNLDTVDPELIALLSPHTGSRNGSSHSLHLAAGFKQPSSASPTTPTFSPSPTTPTFAPAPASRLPRSRQTSSYLPRLLPSNSPSPSPTSAKFLIPTPSPTSTSMNSFTTPKASSGGRSAVIAVNGYDYSPTSSVRSPPSPVLAPTSTPRRSQNLARSTKLFSPPSTRTTNLPSKLIRNEDEKTSPKGNDALKAPRSTSRTLRQVILGTNSTKDAGPASPPSPIRTSLSGGSVDSRRPKLTTSLVNEFGLGRPSLDLRRASYEPRSRPNDVYSRASASTEGLERITPTTTTTTTTEADSSPSPELPFEEPHYRPSFDSTTTRPSFETSSRPGSAARLRDREGSNRQASTPSLRVAASPGERLSPVHRGPSDVRLRRRSMSVQERIAKGRFGGGGGMASSDHGSAAGVSRPGSSLSVHGGGGRLFRGTGFGMDGNGGGSGHEGGAGPKMEWLGPRTAKAFRAAGLLDFEKEKERDGPSTALSSPLSAGSASTATPLNRYGSLRNAASEYNPTPQNRAHSRMAFSEAGGAGHSGRRGSESFSVHGGGSSHAGGGSQYGGYTGLMESPTLTGSSGSRDRDTPKSTPSTAPTSVSETFGYGGRDRADRDWDREEIRDLKDKHTSEMGALLAALSDTQRTVRVLRDENSQLRERLDSVSLMVQENNELRHAFESVERECSALRRELTSLRAIKAPGLSPSWSGSSGTSSGFRTPIAKPGHSSPLVMDSTPSYVETEEEEFNDTVIIHDSLDQLSRYTDTPRPTVDSGRLSQLIPSLKRRSSNSSSIFPMPPPNMTMLMHEDSTANLGSNRNSADQSLFPSSVPNNHQPAAFSKPIATPRRRSGSYSSSQPTYRNFAGPGHANNNSITSNTSISPTTANFSMVTGSPGSLFLRPEHEVLLGDMESLDLGVRSADVDHDAVNQMTSDDEW